MLSVNCHYRSRSCVEEPVQIMQTAPHRRRKMNSWSCGFKQLHHNELGCDCQSKLNRPRGAVTEQHTTCCSPTPTVNGCDWTPPTRKQTCEQEYKAWQQGAGGLQHRTPALHGLSKICWIVKTWSVMLWSGRKLHWVSTSFGSAISKHCFQGTWHILFLEG